MGTKPPEEPPRVRESRGRTDRGREGTETPPTTRETEEIRAGGGNKDMTRRPRTAEPLRPQWGMAGHGGGIG